MRKSNRKGGSNEREMYRLWSLWWSAGVGIDPPRDDVFFYRTSGLGKSTYGGRGDMMALDPVGEPLVKVCTFKFKCGYNQDLDLFAVLDSRQKEPLLLSFIHQIEREVEETKNEPVLVIHRDRHLPIIVLHREFFGELSCWCSLDAACLPRLTVVTEREVYVMLRLQWFFDCVSVNYFLQKSGCFEEED